MTRHELKDQIQHDAFTDTVGAILRFTTANRTQLIRWGVITVLVLAIVGAGIWYSSYRRGLREADLEAAFEVLSAPVGPPNQFGKSFPTEAAKRTASLKALSDVIAKDAGTREGLMAQYYRGTLTAQQDPKRAESDLRAVADSKCECAPLSKVALAQLLSGENRMAEARQLLEGIVNKPADLVSKGQAQILLAQLEQTTNPKQSKQILQSLQGGNQDSAVARAAGQLAAQIR